MGANQMENLQRAGTTRWSSQFDSICSLVDMYYATTKVLCKMKDQIPMFKEKHVVVSLIWELLVLYSYCI
ncbi:hypothetical protein Sjap_001008 [Stephania japonica]|uniref:Uncharacterized protein n=1 Tax=Stephania japonica TaxID=461633 RepID=A0AAP0KKQ7_9MAGN